jgi:hypothetical protein
MSAGLLRRRHSCQPTVCDPPTSSSRRPQFAVAHGFVHRQGRELQGIRCIVRLEFGMLRELPLAEVVKLARRAECRISTNG